MALPGVKVGPLDPDATQDFGQVNAVNSARKLIRMHSQQHPPELVRALARPLDPERTKGLVLDEVRGFVAGLDHENGDPFVPEGARVVGAQVRGDRDTEQIVTFTMRLKSGRTAKWFAPYDPDELAESVDAGDKLVQVKEMNDRGVVAWDSEGTANEILRRENSGLRRQRDALLAKAGDKAAAKEIADEGIRADTRPDVEIVADAEELRRENVEMRERLAELESALGEKAVADQRPDDAGGAGSLAEDPPFAEYDDLNARQLIDRIRDEDTSQDERQRILEYERRHNGRKSVVSAAESAIDRS